jgi:hypothetical protein
MSRPKLRNQERSDSERERPISHECFATPKRSVDERKESNLLKKQFTPPKRGGDEQTKAQEL